MLSGYSTIFVGPQALDSGKVTQQPSVPPVPERVAEELTVPRLMDRLNTACEALDQPFVETFFAEVSPLFDVSKHLPKYIVSGFRWQSKNNDLWVIESHEKTRRVLKA